jgi:hypothetical protein
MYPRRVGASARISIVAGIHAAIFLTTAVSSTNSMVTSGLRPPSATPVAPVSFVAGFSSRT